MERMIREKRSPSLPCDSRVALICLMVALAMPVASRAGEPDCDNNGVPDAMELSGNDCNGNGMLDVCENETILPVIEITGIRDRFYFGNERGDMDIAGDTAVVGDPVVYTPGVGTRGLVYCYSFSTTNGWQPMQVLSKEPELGLNYFGNRVAVDGDRLVVASPGARPTPDFYGAVYCYRRLGGVWELDQTIIGERPRIYFGQQIALEGNRLLIGEYNLGSGPGGSNPWPRVNCYIDRGAGFELAQTFPLSGGGASLDHVLLGNIFTASRDILVIVNPQPIEEWSPGSLPSYTYENAVAIYEWDGRRWSFVSRVSLNESFPNEYSRIGLSDCLVDNEQSRIILTPGRSGDSLAFSSAFVLEKDVNGWRLAHRVTQSPAFANWLEKSFAGYFFGRYEVVLTQGGYTATEHPELAGVIDRSRRSGNWWGALVTEGAEPIATIDQVAGDCDSDGVLDFCELAAGTPDIDGNLVPDSCQMDCNGDGIPDESQLDLGDCNHNGILDVCDVDIDDPDSDGDVWSDCNGNLTPDACDEDCDANGIPDDCDLDTSDPDGDGFVASDCDGNGRPDRCDVQSGFVQIAEVRPGGDITGLTFGFSLAIDGDVLAVGAPSSTYGAPNDGRVFVYRRSGTRWIEEAVIHAGDFPEALVGFGFNLALEGNLLAIQGDTSPQTRLSHVYTFHNDGSTWQHASTLSITQNANIRSDLVIDGGRLALSADDSQSIRVFDFQDNVWNEIHNLSLLDSGGLSERITLHDNILIAGFGANQTRVFRFDGIAWSLVSQTRQFGQTVSIVNGPRPVTDGESIAVGNRTSGCPSVFSSVYCGSSQVYRFAGDDLMIEDILYGSVGNVESALFGYSIALGNDRLVVGAPASSGNIGRVDVFRHKEGNWRMQESVSSPLAPALMAFGSEMASSGKVLAVAATGRTLTNLETDDDVVFIYELDRDVDDNGVLDTCQTDCDANNYPDDGERTITGMVHALLHGGAVCVFDVNDDGAVSGLDIHGYIDLLLIDP